MKDVDALARQLRPQGWRLFRLSGGHLEFRGPNDQRVVTTGSSAGGRALGNLRADLRRAGADLSTDLAPLRVRTPRKKVASSRPPKAPPKTAPKSADSVSQRPERSPRSAVTVSADRDPVAAAPSFAVTCRVQRHAFSPRRKLVAPNEILIESECDRGCGTMKREAIAMWTGVVVSRSYRYADGYLVQAGDERPSLADWRVRWVGGLLDLPEIEAPEAPRTRAEAS